MRSNMPVGRRLLLATLISVIIPVSVFAQAGTGQIKFATTDDQNFPSMKTVVTVVDSNGIPFDRTKLTSSSFAAFEDGKAVAVTAAGAPNPNVPISVLLALDKSGSMAAKSTAAPTKTKLQEAQEAANSFLTSLEPADRAAILAFGDQVDLNRPLANNCEGAGATKEYIFTEDKGALINCINNLETVINQVATPLYDSAYKSVMEAKREAIDRQSTPVVILFSDGKEEGLGGQSASKNPRVAAELAARQEHIAIFTIGLGADADASYLQALAQNTGGEYYSTPDATGLESIYKSIAERLRTQYTLTWPSQIAADGKEHQLDVKVTAAGKELSNKAVFVARKPIKPGIRFQHKRPTGLFNFGRETEVVAMTPGQAFRTNWTIVPDIAARNEIAQVEYFVNNETTPVFTAQAYPFNLPWAATQRDTQKPTAYTVRAVATDKAGNRGEASIAINLEHGGLDPAWIVLIVGLILLIAVVVLIFALRSQRQPAELRVASSPALLESSIPSPMSIPDERAAYVPQGGPAYQPRPTPAARLSVVEGPDSGREFEILHAEMRIGRNPESEVHLQDPTVSRDHATIRPESGQYILYDLGALNPAKVNGRPVSRCRLEDNDRITLGNTILVFRLAR